MSSFIKEHFVIVLGISLPLILIILFLGAKSAPNIFVDPPQYKAVYALQKSIYKGRFYFNVKNGKLQTEYKRSNKDSDYYNLKTVLFIYDPVTITIQEIELETPDLEKGETKQIIIPEMKNVSLIKGNKSPDGYEYIYRNRRGGLFLGIFGGRSGRTQYFLRKNNRYIPLLKGGEKRYSANMYFIGWIKEESGEK